MSRHRGKRRPFTTRRSIWPQHCGCRYHVGEPCSIFDVHRPETVAAASPNLIRDWKEGDPMPFDCCGPKRKGTP